MPDPITGLIAGGATIIGGAMQSSAARSAAETQAGAAREGGALQAEAQREALAEQRRQFERMSEILGPYVQQGVSGIEGLSPFRQAGLQAFQRQQALLGLRGPEAEAAEIAAIQRRPGYLAQQQAGEEAILRRAAVTGGLRRGNVQQALGQFAPRLLAQEIESQYGRLGGLAGAGMSIEERLATLGQASAARQAAAAGGFGEAAAQLLTGGAAAQARALQQAAGAQAAGTLGSAQAFTPLFNLPGQLAGLQYATGRPLFGGGQQPGAPIEYRTMADAILPPPQLSPSPGSTPIGPSFPVIPPTVGAPLSRAYEPANFQYVSY